LVLGLQRLYKMKNYTKYMKKIDGMLEMAKPEKKTPTSGLLAPAKLPKKAQEGTDTDSQIARYISIIRKQKQEVINGR
jgi:hypothetical protein